MGVASCAGSTCHGATRPFADSRIRQDEYILWQAQDRHARAYETLRSERSRRIAQKLGWKEPWIEERCLVCHADYVPAPQRGARYLVSDGVGCEACHGGAERWLQPHVRGYASAQERQRDGLYALEDLPARAQQCLSCHQGDAQRPMTHAIMGAGHPPLLFELDTFTVEMPLHHRLDADYRQRKPVRDGAAAWFVGQVEAARMFLESTRRHAAEPALVPDLVLFDCNACHHSLHALRWEPGIAGPLPPGSLRLADTPLYLVGLWLETAQPQAAARWRDALAALHSAAVKSAAELSARAQELLGWLDGSVQPLAAQRELSAAEMRQLLHGLLDAGMGAQAGDFTKAEQTAMAVAVLHSALAEKEGRPIGERTKSALDGLYRAVRSRDAFEPARYREALNGLKALLKPL